MKVNDSFKFQAAVDPAQLADYLTTLAQAVETGHLPVETNEQLFTVNPQGLIELLIKVRRKNGQGRVIMEMSWTEADQSWPLLDKNQGNNS